jgi:hypothetical protein
MLGATSSKRVKAINLSLPLEKQKPYFSQKGARQNDPHE